MKVIYVGRDIYWKSGTILSSLYRQGDEGQLHRTDWGFVELALERGEAVSITPASAYERSVFEKRLAEIREEQGLPVEPRR